MKEKWNPIVKKRLGQILVERRIISPLRLQAALDRQKKQNGKARYLGQILVEMGIPRIGSMMPWMLTEKESPSAKSWWTWKS